MSNEELVVSNNFFETTETIETEGTTTKSGINFLISNQELVVSNNFSIDSCLCSLCCLCCLCCLYSLYSSLLITHSSLSLPRHYPNQYRKTFIIVMVFIFSFFQNIGFLKERKFENQPLSLPRHYPNRYRKTFIIDIFFLHEFICPFVQNIAKMDKWTWTFIVVTFLECLWRSAFPPSAERW